MPAVLYNTLGDNTPINEVVFAGSHDAAIKSGGMRAQTQKYSIGTQAHCGVRIFDIRISGQRTGLTGAKLSAFHGSNTPSTVSKKVGGVKTNIEVTRMIGGAWGMDLDDILRSAFGFVEDNKKEFLILKFDKSSNYEMILDACDKRLGKRLYKDKGNIATKTLGDMAGKIVCAFMPDGFNKLTSAQKDIDDGVAQIVNLHDTSVSKPASIDGLVYYGKGGTSILQPGDYWLSSPVQGKFKENIDKQRVILSDAKQYGPDVLRMMYWTQTGMVRSIKGRDKKAWTTKSKDKLRQLWAEGGYKELQQNAPRSINLTSHAVNYKRYLPNFIMVDFADMHKGQTIRDLNDLSVNELVALNGDLDD